ncbi:hypothetical protein TCAL_02908 [Tigriopus californicus]|uniref:TOG domain-containing protein n=1 Tax=Tigriopus californicus TaxID=6832 RepID=A0A553NQN0_TIGCA|nr:importin-5-like [Tigriopus californicus]TRY67741.1 hypothetical protein TCAL_02908 [Tigriopus californicus]|eukprot:TCALIF_02908-PA protein Name:"Similar to Ipo5 Importin-5 (Mus musculus)" AED:0.06 eAED:0.06 QI:236/1/1/1/1/1/11/646/1109
MSAGDATVQGGGGGTAALLRALMSTENAIRSQAEQNYETLAIAQKVTMLFSALTTEGQSVGEEGRQLAAVMLRRLISTDFEEFYPKLAPDQQAQFKQNLLMTLPEEPNKTVRKKVADLVAEVARNLMDDDGNNLWPEFLKFLFDLASSPNPELKEVALHLFSTVPTVFGNQETQYLEVIKQMLATSLNDQTSFDVRFAAVKAAINYLLLHEKESTLQKNYGDLLLPILNVTMESVEKGDDESALKALIDLAESCPKYLRPQLEQLFVACIKIYADKESMDSWRHLALEIIVTLAETAPAMVRKVAGEHLAHAIQATLHMMTEVEEEDDWATSDELADDDNDSNAVVAESALDRLSCGLGGKTVFPHILQNTPQMLSQADWKFRHAALMAISAAGEGCHKQMESFLPQIMEGVMNFINDPHPRVRFAACNAIGQMSTDFAPVFEKKFHDKVIPGLLHLMDDHANPRVQAHAGAALVNFSEDCPKAILAPYLEGIICKLESILSSKFKELVEKGNKLVLEQIVTTIASVADTAEEKFVAYYDRFVPCLKYIIQNANTQELRLLRGKTIECISLIGLAVGGEKFMSDAGEVMEMLLKTQKGGTEEMSDDDPQMSYMISAWARICKIMGPRFAPYLPLVMGPIMKTASLKPEVALLDNEELGGVENETEDWQFVSLGEQQNFGIKTAGLEDKATACTMLVCYARELKEHFVDYAEPTVKLMVPMLKFYFHDGVRSAAAESLPCLLECAKIRGPQYVQEMWSYICPELLKAIDAEPETDVLAEHLQALARCVELLGLGCLSEQAMGELIKIMLKTLQEHYERQGEREKKRKDEDYDEGVEEQLEEEDDDDVFVLSKLGDLLHALFSTHKESMIPVFDQLLPSVVKLLDKSHPWSDHQWGLCIFDDVIEFLGPASTKYKDHFIQPLLHYLGDKQAEVRQAAAYGCGVLGQFGGPEYAQICATALQPLIQLIEAPNSREVENVNPTENAISAVTKILKWNSSVINVDEILPIWFNWLPVYEDVDESPFVYGYLCDLVEINHPVVLGANNANLPKVVSVVAEAFCCDALPPNHEVKTRMINIVKQVQTNQGLFQACIGSLQDAQKQALSEAMSTAQS